MDEHKIYTSHEPTVLRTKTESTLLPISPRLFYLVNLIIIILVGLLGFLLGYYLSAPNSDLVSGNPSTSILSPSYSPTQNNTTVKHIPNNSVTIGDWKTFSNDKYNYSIQYPTHFQLLEVLPNELAEQFDIKSYSDISYFKSDLYHSYIHISKNCHSSGNLGDYSKIISTRTLRFEGKSVEVRVVDWKAIPPSKQWEYYNVQLAIISDDTVDKDFCPDKAFYQVLMLFNPSLYPKAESDFDHILSKFQFLN